MLVAAVEMLGRIHVLIMSACSHMLIRLRERCWMFTQMATSRPSRALCQAYLYLQHRSIHTLLVRRYLDPTRDRRRGWAAVKRQDISVCAHAEIERRNMTLHVFIPPVRSRKRSYYDDGKRLGTQQKDTPPTHVYE